MKDKETFAIYASGGWDLGTVNAFRISVGGQQVVGTQAADILDPSGGTNVDVEARTALTEVLAALRHYGLISS